MCIDRLIGDGWVMFALRAVEDSPDERQRIKLIKFSESVLYLFGVGCVLDVLSTFFPWSIAAGYHWFLPFSVPIPLGYQIDYITDSPAVLAVNLTVRLGAILGLVGLLLLALFKNRIVSTPFLITSTGLSFASVAVFSQTGWPFYIGVYMVLASGFLKLFTLILVNLEVEIVVEKEDETSNVKS